MPSRFAGESRIVRMGRRLDNRRSDRVRRRLNLHPARGKGSVVARKRFAFTLILGGLQRLNQEVEDRLYEAGCDDALLGQRDGTVFLDFDREAESLEAAIVTAIRDVRRAKTSAVVTRVEPDDLVSQAEIARRLGQSRESVRKYVLGVRGPGGFPAPVAGVKGTSALWRWSEVARWLTSANLLDRTAVDDAELIAAVNSLLTIGRSSSRSKLGSLVSSGLAAALLPKTQLSKARDLANSAK